MPRTNTEKDFWSRVDKSETCWIWTGSSRRGYGCFLMNRQRFQAHRFSWKLKNGDIPTGKLVLHKCDNPPCVNPDHLFLGNQLLNRADCVLKGRQARGSGSGMAKLTEELVLAIRAADGTQRSIARRFGVSASNVNFILSRATWKHV